MKREHGLHKKRQLFGKYIARVQLTDRAFYQLYSGIEMNVGAPLQDGEIADLGYVNIILPITSDKSVIFYLLPDDDAGVFIPK